MSDFNFLYAKYSCNSLGKVMHANLGLACENYRYLTSFHMNPKPLLVVNADHITMLTVPNNTNSTLLIAMLPFHEQSKKNHWNTGNDTNPCIKNTSNESNKSLRVPLTKSKNILPMIWLQRML